MHLSLALLHDLFKPPALIGLFALQTYIYQKHNQYMNNTSKLPRCPSSLFKKLSAVSFCIVSVEKIIVSRIHHFHEQLCEHLFDKHESFLCLKIYPSTLDTKINILLLSGNKYSLSHLYYAVKTIAIVTIVHSPWHDYTGEYKDMAYGIWFGRLDLKS